MLEVCLGEAVQSEAFIRSCSNFCDCCGKSDGGQTEARSDGFEAAKEVAMGKPTAGAPKPAAKDDPRAHLDFLQSHEYRRPWYKDITLYDSEMKRIEKKFYDAMTKDERNTALKYLRSKCKGGDTYPFVLDS